MIDFEVYILLGLISPLGRRIQSTPSYAVVTVVQLYCSQLQIFFVVDVDLLLPGASEKWCKEKGYRRRMSPAVHRDLDNLPDISHPHHVKPNV